MFTPAKNPMVAKGESEKIDREIPPAIADAVNPIAAWKTEPKAAGNDTGLGQHLRNGRFASGDPLPYHESQRRQPPSLARWGALRQDAFVSWLVEAKPVKQ